MAEVSMVKKVAKAISNTYGPQMHWENCVVMARAAIEAMREPTEFMVKLGSQAGPWTMDRYKAMIDAALNGKEG